MNVPLEVCEARDPKGLYKLARAGKIKGIFQFNIQPLSYFRCTDLFPYYHYLKIIFILELNINFNLLAYFDMQVLLE